MKKDWKKILLNMRLNIIILVAFVILAIVSVHLLQNELLKKNQGIGMSLAKNYSMEEQNNIIIYKTLTAIGAQYIDEQVQQGASPEVIRKWLDHYAENIKKNFGKEAVDPFAVVNGKIIAANPWEGDNDYDLTNAQWYREAMAAGGDTIFTDTYTDAISGKPVITIAQKTQNSDSIFAFDVFPENFHTYDNPLSLPEGGSYYLCDQKGTLLYYRTDLNKTADEYQSFVDQALQKIAAGSLDSYDSYIQDLQGDKKSVYYYEMSNGWISILTIPKGIAFSQLFYFYVILSVVFLIFLVLIIAMAVKHYRQNKEVERANETIQVLGNSYYAIYRVNYQAGTYEAIKASEPLLRSIPARGRYYNLLDAAQEVVDKDAYKEFINSFSPESIRELVAKQEHLFGGDFLRRFGTDYKWVNVRILFDESLAPDEVVLCFREVDQEKQQQLKQLRLLEAALESARKSEKTKNAFFSNMSHDMRTPLNAIIGLSELAALHLKEPDKLEGYMTKIAFSGKQLLGLINDVLEISRMEQGKLALEYKPLNLKQCVEECTDPFKAQSEKEKKDFQVLFELQDPVVMGDAFRIGQIINNLVSNALKYSEEGSRITVKVKQRIYQQNMKYQIIVEDTGIGMSEEFLATIYEPYARENRFGTKSENSTGLGMSIVKNLVQQMSGEITVESQLGKGSTFTVTIPLQIVNEEEPPLDADSGEKQDYLSLKGKRILLAEDNQANMEIASEILSLNGIEVVQAWNGEEAIEAFCASDLFSLDAILMDMQMPKIDGCQAAKTIRMLNRPDAGSIPIIAVTANAFAEDIALTTEAGMNAHISKPIDFNILYRTLQDLIC